MPMSLDEFRASLLRADLRDALGIRLADDEAQRVHDDPTASQNWYAYWLALNPQPQAPAAPVVSPPPPQDAGFTRTAPIQATMPVPAHPGDAHPTMPLYEAAPPPVAPAGAYGAQPSPYDAASVYPPAPQTAKKRNVGLWVTLSILGALILIAVIVVVAAFATARHWTKVDVPEQPETFHSEEYETGRYDVTMDAVNPCWVDQDWTDCTNLMVATYNAACVDVELTEDATALCSEYSSAIDEMKAEDGDGYTVATLGTFGSLQKTAEVATREVSNEDYRPAVTHEAVCYLGFIGECR